MIQEVISKIHQNPDRIDDVYCADKEFYFRFGDLIFSLGDETGSGDLVLYVYPKWERDLESLHRQITISRDAVPWVNYRKYELPQEIRDRLHEIYKMLQEKTLGLDKRFVRILSS